MAGASAPSVMLLIPEFPGQTHNFFWREVAELEALGARVQLASTRRPPTGVQSPHWAAQAIARTGYLLPLAPAALPGMAWVALRAGPLRWWRALGVILGSEGGIQRNLKLAALALIACRLVALARAAGIRHVHVHSCADAALVALFAQLLGGLDYSLTLHGALAHYGPDQSSKWRHARFAIVVSQTLLAQVRTALAGALPARVTVAPMGVDTGFFQRQQPFQPWRPGQPLRVFSCARLNRHKGHATAVQLVAALLADGLDVTLQIAGEDDRGGAGYRQELTAQIAALGLASRVTLLGALSAFAVREQQEHAHLFVLLSEDEALGVAYMEAMAMELPVLGCRVGGVPELIEDGVCGRLVPPGSADSARAAVHAMLDDASAAVRMGQRARQVVVERFSSRCSAQALLAGLATEA